MKLTVVLGASSEASFDIVLNDNSFTRKWVKELSWCLSNCKFNQLEAFAGLTDLETASEILKSSCEVINKYIPNFIEIRPNIIIQPQEYFNYLHIKFEKLSGGFETPTRLISIANPELKSAIRNLNFFVHRVETKRESRPTLYISFDKDMYRRHPLADTDYEFFEFQIPAGTLVLHYAELGKELIDLYQDNLPINYNALRNLHYYSGEASVLLSEYLPFDDTNYVKWLEENNIDPYNKKLGHGKIPLGIFADLDDAKQKIIKYPYLNKILIEE